MTERKKNGELLGSHSRRFALLYNVEGLKYTIGQYFESRRRQGEYLFCYGKGVAKSSHCEITCGSGGQFWVEDLQGWRGNGTFVNGERIHDRVRVELKFGDTLALGDPNSKQDPVNAIQMEVDEELADDDGFTSFLFMVVEESASAQNNELVASQGCSQIGGDLEAKVEVESTPLTNALVLSKIFGYLDRLSDIKKCRLVCSRWNEEATKLLKCNSATSFNYPDAHSNYFAAVKSSRLFTFVQEMGGFFPQGNFRVTLPSCFLPNCICKNCRSTFNNWGSSMGRRRNSELKLFSDLKWFFGGGFPHPITNLSLTGTLRNKPGCELMAAVLKECSPHLQDLTLSMSFDLTPGANIIAPFGVNFPSLRKLEIKLQLKMKRRCCSIHDDSSSDSDDDSCDDWDFESYDKVFGKWNTSMITSAPGLQSLNLANWSQTPFESFGVVFMDKVIKLKGFPNLNSLELMSYNSDVLKSILQLPKLNSLNLGVERPDCEDDEGNYDDDDEDYEPWTVLLSNVLNKSAETLKYLDLALPDGYLRANRESILLPIFSNLTVFKLYNFYPGCLAILDSEFGFKTHFPKLKHFFTSGAEEDDFFDVFFPDVEVGTCDDDLDAKGQNVVTGAAGEDEESQTSSSHFGSYFDDSDDEEKDDENNSQDGERQTNSRSAVWNHQTFWNYQITKKKQVDEEVVVTSVRLLEMKIGNWSRAGVDKMGQLFPNAFNKDLEAVRAKELARPRWNWSKWSFVAGADLRPVKLKKNN